MNRGCDRHLFGLQLMAAVSPLINDGVIALALYIFRDPSTDECAMKSFWLEYNLGCFMVSPLSI